MRGSIRAAFFVVLAAAVLLVGARSGLAGVALAQEPTPTPTPVTTGNIPVIAINPAMCFLLVAVQDQTMALNCNELDAPGGVGANALLQLADFLGDGDGIIEPSDFAGIDLDGNQLHQMDPAPTDPTELQNVYNGNLYIIAFVNDDGPTDFKTDRGEFIPPWNTSVSARDPISAFYHCDDRTGGVLDTPDDQDCDGLPGGNHVVVARLGANVEGKIADRGPGTVIIRQGTDEATIAFRVVGEPHDISFITLKNTIQTGITDLADNCGLPTDAAGFLGSSGNGSNQRAIVLAIAADVDGNSVTGALINWYTDDANKGAMAAPLTPTLDLGAFGFGAPNILCGTKNPGTVTIKGEIAQTTVAVTGNIPADPAARVDSGTVDFTVVGPPASITLTADPASLPCDGTSTSTVTAKVTDAAGSNASPNTPVNFNVQVLGTANPINPQTNADGVATSVITPLAAGATGVPVVVTAGNVSASILIECTQPGPEVPTAGPGASTPAPGGGTGSGGIIGPNTGSGGDVAGRATAAPWLAVLAAGLALAAVATLRTARAMRR